MHKNTEIRNEIANILTVTGSGIKIFNSRLVALPDSELPAIAIYTDTETALKTLDELGYDRESSVVIVCYVRGLDKIYSLPTGEKSVDEKLDNLFQFLEDRLLTQYQTLNKKVFRLNFTGVSGITSEPIGENGIKLIAYTTWAARYNQQIANT